MVSTKQKHDLKFEQNPSLWMAIKSSYYTRAVWVKVKRERKKKILIYYDSERQMLNTNNTQGVS